MTVLHRGMRSTGIDGIGQYTKELASRFQLDEELQLLPFTFGGDGRRKPPAAAYQLPAFAVSAVPALLSSQPFWGSKQFTQKVDLVHATDHLIPKCSGVPVVATIMDAIPLAHPEWVNHRFRALKREIWKKTASFADQIITISEHSKSDIVRFFRIPERRIAVIPLGVDERWFAKPSELLLNQIRRKYQLPERFFVFVGTLQPRKNVARIIDAHRQLPRFVRQAFPLVIVGRKGWGCEEIEERLRADDALVRWLEYVAGDDLPSILRCAFALVFPSLHEGFGLPVLEAFASELPVITSNTTSLPEVAGDAAILVDPYDTECITEALLLLAENPSIAQGLRAKGVTRARSFTWGQTATATKQIYNNLR